MRKLAGLKKSDLLVIVGGSPCQPFSKAAYWTESGSDAAYRRARANGIVLEKPAAPTHSKASDVDNKLKPWVTAGEVLADLDKEENSGDEGHFAGGQHHELLRGSPPGENYLHYTAERGHPSPIFKRRSGTGRSC